MNESNLYGMLGLARRSGNVVIGYDGVCGALKNKAVCLVLVSKDCSDNTKKRITDKCRYYMAEYIMFGISSRLGKAVGCGDVAVLAVTDGNFATAIKNIYNNLTEVAEDGSC